MSSNEQQATSNGALSDVRVLDLTRLLPGGFCSLLLADFGAEVVKVEDTGGGDYVRWAPPYYGDEEHQPLGTRSALYLSLNRGKRSIRIDLKSDAGRDAFLRLAREYDVVLESFRPGVLDRLGVGYGAFARSTRDRVLRGHRLWPDRAEHGARRPRHQLPRAERFARPHRGAGRPARPGGQIADLGGGALMAAFGVMAALHERRASGEGQLVDVSMTDGSLAWLAMVAGRYFCDGVVPRRGDNELAGRIVCYFPYEAADGWVSCGALEPKFWQAFCRGVGREDLIEKQFERPGSDAWREVAEIFRSRTREEWRAFNDEHDCCIEPVLDLDEALDSDLVRAREMVVELDQPHLGPVRQLGVPVKMSRTPGAVDAPAPALGEHTRAVLGDVGYSDEEIDAMIESGAVAGAATEGSEAVFRA